MRRRDAFVLPLLLVALLPAACADPVPHAEVTVRLTEFSLNLSPARSNEGAVRLFVDNTGRLKHSLVFVRAERREDLPLKPDGSVDLAKAQVADQLQPVAPGHYRIAPDLFPGRLIVFCNLVTIGPDGQPISHFQRGMWAPLEIRRSSSSASTPAR